MGCTDMVVRIYDINDGIVTETEAMYKLKHPIEAILVHSK
jgi:hypothetical protein